MFSHPDYSGLMRNYMHEIRVQKIEDFVDEDTGNVVQINRWERTGEWLCEYSDESRRRVGLVKQMVDCLKRAGNAKVAICIDWLSVLFNETWYKIPEPQTEGNPETFAIGDKFTLHYIGKGNEWMKHIYHVFFGGEHLATLLAHTRSPKFVKEGVVKLDFQNHLLYTNRLWDVYDTITTELGFEYKNISRLDIAVDGLNYLMDFMNLYNKQYGDDKVVEMKGVSRFNAKVLDRKTMKYQNFFIGGSKGRKSATIYNKTLDIVKTGKNYIQEYWKNNGMLNDLLPLEKEMMRLSKDKNKQYIEGYENIFRYEVRLRGERISEIEDFSIDMLKSPDSLASILKLMNRGFVDFVWNDNDRTNLSTKIELVPFDRFNIIPLTKVDKRPKTDLYKTKLSIHKNIKQLFTARHSLDDNGVWDMIKFDINEFELIDWFKKRYYGEWLEKYSKLSNDKEHVEMVIQAVEDLINGYDANNQNQLNLGLS